MAEGKEKYFLSYNKVNIFQALIQSETHFRNLKESEHASDEKGHANCIVKHLAEAEGESSEAISHSLMVEGEEASKKFKALRDEIRGLREKLQSRNVPPEEGIREIRRIRRFFEGFNKEYDVSKCKACGSIEEILAKLKIPKTGIADLEEETAHRMLEHLSTKYNVQKPRLTLLEKCPAEPTQFGLFQKCNDSEPEIILCIGSADGHKLAHEFCHHLQALADKPSDEREAEEFALKETAPFKKTLYVEATHSYVGERSMPVTWTDVGVSYGGQHIGKGLALGFKEVDKYFKKEAEKVEAKPSTWLTLGLAVGLPLAAVYFKIKSPWDELAVLVGGHLSTEVWDYVGEYAAGAVATGVYVPAQVRATSSSAESIPSSGIVYV